MNCPKCGSANVNVQVFQEQQTKIKSKSRPRKSNRHFGFITKIFYWCFVGWWIWIFKLLLPKGRRDRSDDCKTTSKVKSKSTYKKMCVCQACGNTWEI